MHGTNPFNGPMQGYGAVNASDSIAGYSAQNPSFPVNSSLQQVQPAPQDIYMHGSVQDRNY